tara:strand:+ start:5431 stop:6483 length:1053 start_codon:yes stop_codon:yes gene_type:complete
VKIAEKFMSRCIELAKNGLGTTYPNPLVGSVVVVNDSIIGEGWHYRAGLPHAEVNAINSVLNKDLLQRSTIYVSLEPCSHFGKTPPCADLIIASGIKKVVIGSLDPNPKVAGRGVKKLMEAGCDVVVGILADECDQLNKRFFTFHLKKRPYIILKWAQTLNGFIAPVKSTRRNEKKPVWITNEYARQFVHKLRAQEQAILVGTTTVLDDDPGLTTRNWYGKSPVRVVIDKDLKIPTNATVFNLDESTILISENNANYGEHITLVTADFSEELAPQICDILYKNGIQSVIVEGGSKTLQSFIDSNLWDEASVYTGNATFEDGVAAPKLSEEKYIEEKIKDNTLQSFINSAH